MPRGASTTYKQWFLFAIGCSTERVSSLFWSFLGLSAPVYLMLRTISKLARHLLHPPPPMISITHILLRNCCWSSKFTYQASLWLNVLGLKMLVVFSFLQIQHLLPPNNGDAAGRGEEAWKPGQWWGPDYKDCTDSPYHIFWRGDLVWIPEAALHLFRTAQQVLQAGLSFQGGISCVQQKYWLW